jgi:hypothetical protein
MVVSSDQLSNDEEVMVVGYCLALSQTAVHYSKLAPASSLRFIPSVISTLSEFMVYSSERIIHGAFTGINNLIYYSVS